MRGDGGEGQTAKRGREPKRTPRGEQARGGD